MLIEKALNNKKKLSLRLKTVVYGEIYRAVRSTVGHGTCVKKLYDVTNFKDKIDKMFQLVKLAENLQYQ